MATYGGNTNEMVTMRIIRESLIQSIVMHRIGKCHAYPARSGGDPLTRDSVWK